MSDFEIYTIAKVARGKLLSEYNFKDHNLHRLVAHANLYDSLLDAYHKQAEESTEKPSTDSSTSTTKRGTFKVPSRSKFPNIRPEDKGQPEDDGGQPNPSTAPRGKPNSSDPSVIDKCEHLEHSEDPTEAIVTETMFVDDG